MSGPQLLVRRHGIFIAIGMADGSAIPQHLWDMLTKPLVYNHVEHLRGLDQLQADGTRRHVEITPRRLYDRLPTGELQTSLGMLPRLAQIAAGCGYSLTHQDLSPAKPRPKAYVPDWERLDARFTVWRYRQRECVGTVAQALGGVINAIPAFGKTEMLCRLAVLFPTAKFAVVTSRRDVAQTIFRRLTRVIPQVGFVGDGKRKYGRVTVYVSKSLRHADPDVDFMFADEAHELCTDTDAEMILRTFVYSRNFAFTATPYGRKDGTSIRLEYMFGPQIFYLSWQEGTANGLVVPVEVRWLNVQMDINPAAGYSNDTYVKKHGLWNNTIRNTIIASAALSHGDEQVLILVDTIEHAVRLHQLLPGYSLCYGNSEDARFDEFVSEGTLPEGYKALKPADRERMRQEFEEGTLRHVIATDVWSTGVSFEQLTVLIRGAAGDSETADDQAPGRVVRTHEASGKAIGIVYDCWDYFDKRFAAKSAARFRRYKKKGWTQVRQPVRL